MKEKKCFSCGEPAYLLIKYTNNYVCNGECKCQLNKETELILIRALPEK